MTPIDPHSGSTNPIDSMKWQAPTLSEANGNQSLTQEDFFSLLSQQLAMQDPFKPVDNDQMISQMSSFATVDGISSLNGGIDTLNASMASNQALQASGLVGQKVLLASDTTYLSEPSEGASGVVDIAPGTQNPRVQIFDGAGQVLRTIPLAPGASGKVDFHWDGLAANGQPVLPGSYSFTATGLVDGKAEALRTHAYGHVSSVTLGGADKPTMLNLKGLGSVAMNEILAVADA
ncbi:flagellar hook assembly protein FlgD [Ferrimonas senticii]|uniref:flagellar hook assembly protein FlgD n=1 Tax=Ferrimonas senticii TaxID=394566 RepID=UPI0004123BF9|nr:flagellar hook assembly protein FlgD [Ferrimonas senticii]